MVGGEVVGGGGGGGGGGKRGKWAKKDFMTQ